MDYGINVILLSEILAIRLDGLWIYNFQLELTKMFGCVFWTHQNKVLQVSYNVSGFS